MKFTVTVMRTISTEVEVEADSAEAAVAKVERADFPLPPRDEWTGHKNWDIFVDDEDDEDDLSLGDSAEPVPDDYPVKVLGPDDEAKDRATCGTCLRSWDDGISTSMTPAPSGRCPFEYYH